MFESTVHGWASLDAPMLLFHIKVHMQWSTLGVFDPLWEIAELLDSLIKLHLGGLTLCM